MQMCNVNCELRRVNCIASCKYTNYSISAVHQFSLFTAAFKKKSPTLKNRLFRLFLATSNI